MRLFLSSVFLRPVAGTFFWIVAFAWSTSSAFGAELALAANGSSAYQIVLPDKSPSSAIGDSLQKIGTRFLYPDLALANGGIWRPDLIHALDPNPKKEQRSQSDSQLDLMRALHKERKWQNFLEQFAKADFKDWPQDQATEAYHIRGQVHLALKQGKQAEADLKSALKLAPRQELIWLSLADTYRDALLDDEQALATYRHLFQLTGKNNGWLPIHTTLSMARVLTDQVKPDKALEVLQEYGNMEGMAPVWRIKMLRAYGHVYAAQGKEQESLEKFREALRLEAQK